MPDIKLKIEYLDEFESALREAPQKVTKHLQRAFDLAGNKLLSETKAVIREGREMWKAPIDTGYMWNNIFLTVSALKAELVPLANYAVYVHEGTSRMVARPFFEIAERSVEPEINSIFLQELNAALDEMAGGV